MKTLDRKKLCVAIFASTCALSNAYAAKPFTMGNTEVTIGGYIKADLIASDADSNLNNGSLAAANQVVLPAAIPLEGSAKADEDDVTLHARESRLFIATKSGDLKTKLEGDFFGAVGNERSSNSNSFRIRVAWAEYGNWGFGQNWSAAVIFPSFPDQLNFSGWVGGFSALRQTSFRYTNGGFVFALENPETSISNAGSSFPSLQGTDEIPDIISRYGIKSGNASIQGSLLVRELSDSTGDLTDTGFGALVGGSLKLGSNDDIKFLVGHGAIGRFVGDNTFADAQIVNGDLEALDVSSAQIAYRHFWGKGIRSTVLYSYSKADNDSSFDNTSVNKEASTAMINLLWNTSPKTTVGIELSQTQREDETGAEGELNRVQFSMKQKF